MMITEKTALLNSYFRSRDSVVDSAIYVRHVVIIFSPAFCRADSFFFFVRIALIHTFTRGHSKVGIPVTSPPKCTGALRLTQLLLVTHILKRIAYLCCHRRRRRELLFGRYSKVASTRLIGSEIGCARTKTDTAFAVRRRFPVGSNV